MYAPESPRREAYIPESPRRETVVIDNNSRIGKIIQSVKNIHNFKFYKSPFQPIYKYDEYLKARNFVDKKLNIPYNIHREESDRNHREHFEKYPLNTTPPPPTEDPLKDVPKDPYHVIVSTKVTKNGQIKVTTHAPMCQLMVKYHNKGLKPPVDEYIRALKAFRYPQEYLLKVIEHDERMTTTLGERQEFVDTVFGVSKGSTSSKTMKKSIKKIVGVRK